MELYYRCTAGQLLDIWDHNLKPHEVELEPVKYNDCQHEWLPYQDGVGCETFYCKKCHISKHCVKKPDIVISRADWDRIKADIERSIK